MPDEDPVIFLTADEDVDTETRVFEVGVSDFIRKPFNPDVLLRRIDNIMSNSQEMHELKSEATLDKLTGFLNKSAAAVELGKMCSEKTGCLMMTDLDFLARAGQVGNGMANLVKSLMGRPLLVLRNGKMGAGMTYFGTRETAWKAYINSVMSKAASIDTSILFVTYVGISKDDLDWIREQIEKHMHFDEIYFKQASPAVSVNCGPGTFGLLYIEKY